MIGIRREGEGMKRRNWGYPTKSLDKAQEKLKSDLRFYGNMGVGNCAKLDERHPLIIKRQHKDGSIWYQTEVDDIVLELETC